MTFNDFISYIIIAPILMIIVVSVIRGFYSLFSGLK